MPPKHLWENVLTDSKKTSEILLHNREILAVQNGNHYERWALNKKGEYILAGLSRETPEGYVHGSTIEELEEDRKHKLFIAQQKHAEQKKTKRADRAINLLAQIGKNLEVTVEDCRAVGFCWVGIESFKTRYEIKSNTARAEILRKTGDTRVLPAIKKAAQRVLEARGII